MSADLSRRFFFFFMLVLLTARSTTSGVSYLASRINVDRPTLRGAPANDVSVLGSDASVAQFGP
jgi:hypothetical protein